MSVGLPDEHVNIKFEIIEDHIREICLIGSGHQAANLIKALEFFLN
jgi:hypothetical protein